MEFAMLIVNRSERKIAALAYSILLQWFQGASNVRTWKKQVIQRVESYEIVSLIFRMAANEKKQHKSSISIAFQVEILMLLET